jgi:hypothetical protein
MDSTMATFNTNTPTIEVLSSASGGMITGIYANSFSLIIHDTVSNYTINRCVFHNIDIGFNYGNTPPSNISISETIINNALYGGKSPLNVFVSKCFIGALSNGNNYCIYGENTVYDWQGLVCNNCIFFSSNSGNSLLYLISNSTFQNCIFIDNGTSSIIGGTINVFRNCLSNKSSGFLTNVGTVLNCIFDQTLSSTFVNQQSNTFDIHDDYHLSPNSPGRNAGSDGTDIGIYGTVNPFKIGGIPFNPHVQLQQINTQTNQNGDLPVNITVGAQDH